MGHFITNDPRRWPQGTTEPSYFLSRDRAWTSWPPALTFLPDEEPSSRTSDVCFNGPLLWLTETDSKTLYFTSWVSMNMWINSQLTSRTLNSNLPTEYGTVFLDGVRERVRPAVGFLQRFLYYWNTTHRLEGQQRVCVVLNVQTRCPYWTNKTKDVWCLRANFLPTCSI